MKLNKLSTQTWKEFWDKIADEYNIDWTGKQRNKIAIKMAGKNNKILDIGCGKGQLIESLEKNNNKVIGVDFSQKMIDICKTKGLNVQLSEAETLPFNSEEFNIISAIGLIEYLEEDNKFLQEVSRVLKLNGKLILEMRNELFKYWSGRVYQPERRSHNPENLKLNGFKIKKIKYYHPHYFPPKFWYRKKYICSAFVVEAEKI